METQELKEMKEQSHKHRPVDDITYDERVWWHRGFTAGWTAKGDKEKDKENRA